MNGGLTRVNERKLYRFTNPGNGELFVQLVAPTGSTLRASLELQSFPTASTTPVRNAFDSAGIPGAISNMSFVAAAGKDYYVIVDGLGASTGNFTLNINTIPGNDVSSNKLYFPEGFASANTSEFISIVNPGDALVRYSVRLNYENPSIPDVLIADRFMLPRARDGVTIKDGSSYITPGLALNEPYAMIIESDGPLGATLAHYDFGTSIGDSFTEKVSKSWTFAQAERREGKNLDFITFYNPSNVNIETTLTMYQNGRDPVVVRNFYFAESRGGFDLNNSITDYISGQVVQPPTGDYSIVLTAKAVNPAQEAQFEGIVASMSHYNTAEGTGYAVLGDADGGGTKGVVTNLIRSTRRSSQVTFFNSSTSPATVSITGSYIQSALPSFTRSIQVPARGQYILTGTELNLAIGQTVGLTYTSNRAVSATSSITQNGDADGVLAADVA